MSIDFKYLSKIALVIVFIALGNSLIVHPAMELQKKHIASHAQESNGDESQCCFICHPAHYQWFVDASTVASKCTVSSTLVSYHTFAASPDPRIGSIFRPPLAI